MLVSAWTPLLQARPLEVSWASHPSSKKLHLQRNAALGSSIGVAAGAGTQKRCKDPALKLGVIQRLRLYIYIYIYTYTYICFGECPWLVDAGSRGPQRPSENQFALSVEVSMAKAWLSRVPSARGSSAPLTGYDLPPLKDLQRLLQKPEDVDCPCLRTTQPVF